MTAEQILAEIDKRAEEYIRMNSLYKFKDPEIAKVALEAFKDGLLSAFKEGLYNPQGCYGYFKEEWEHQEPKIRQIFGHSNAYTVEQYVNGLIDKILNP